MLLTVKAAGDDLKVCRDFTEQNGGQCLTLTTRTRHRTCLSHPVVRSEIPAAARLPTPI